MRRLAVLCALCVLLAPATVRATVGGETLCEVLGWEASTQRVYVHQWTADGGDSFGRVLSIDLAGPHAGEPRPEPWLRSGEGTANDPELQAQLRRLRARLRPLHPAAWQTLPIRSEVVASDSVANDMGQSRRLRMRVWFSAGLAFEVTTWGSSTVVRPAAYEIPGRSDQIWILAFMGDPFEVGYETQVPVLVRKDDAGTRTVEWRRAPHD